MNTKQILIVIFAFFLGGILGFLINGQMQTNRFERMMLSRPMNMQHNGYNQPERMHHRRQQNHGWKHYRNQMPPAVARMIDEIDLSADQEKQIEGIIRSSNLRGSDLRNFNIEKVEPVLTDIRKVLDEEQNKKLDKIIKEQALTVFF